MMGMMFLRRLATGIMSKVPCHKAERGFHMPPTHNIAIRTATAADAAVIADLTRRAFVSQCKLYGVTDLPPMADTAESVHHAMDRGVVLVATVDERVVGSVRGEMVEGVCLVGRLVVEPELQGAGIGRALAMAIESHFPAAPRFEIFTGHLSAGPLHLYESLGYIREREQQVADEVTLVFLGKSGRS